MTLSKLTTTQLWAELRAGLAQSADGILRMAKVWVELQRRGEDLSGYQSPMLAYLPAVASGKLLPELLLRFGSSYGVLEQVVTLVLEDQHRIAQGDGKVEVVTTDGKVSRTRLADLTIPKLRQVIGDGHIRTPDEQRPHVVQAPRPAEPRASVDPDEWNLRNALDSTQMVDLQKRAEKAGLTPAEYAVRCMVSHRRLKDKVAPVTRETRRGLQDAHPRHA